MYDYYKDGSRSFIPIFFIAYHLFHKKLESDKIKSYFNNFETGNSDYIPMKNWLYHSLLNGVFRSRGAGWVSYKTGIRKLLSVIKDFKNEEFPVKDLFDVYIQHPLNFELNYSKESLNNLDSSFVYYLIYDRKESLRINDVDHIMPKFILQSYNYSWDKINSISNYQLLDYSTNRGNKNSSSFNDWINNKDNVKDKKQYVKIHLIPDDESLWLEKEFEKFIDKRAELIIEKISSYL